MPSPVAHTLAGLSIAWIATPTGDSTAPPRRRLLWAGACAFAANAPDLDFLAGWLAGSVNAFHGGPTHSLLIGVLFAGVLALALRRRTRSVGFTFCVLAAAYGSHVGLDLLSGFVERPNALALFWPFDDTRYTAPWHPFPGIIHGPPGADLSAFLDEVFSMHNLRALTVEATLGLPILAVGVFGRRARTGGTADDVSAT